MVMNAAAVRCLGKMAHISSCDTDVLVLALRKVPDLTTESLIVGSGELRRKTETNNAIGPKRVAAAALFGLHALRGCYDLVISVESELLDSNIL